MVNLHPDLQNHVFTYDDIIINPTKPVRKFERDDVDLTTQFTKDIKLKIPLVSSPMDTVTNADVAILMALMGGIGVLHYNYQTIHAQIDEAEKVKRYEAAFVRDPICLKPDNTIDDIYKIHEKYGFFSVPITEDGTCKAPMLGFVSHRDVRYKKDMSIPLREIMTHRTGEDGTLNLITAHRKDTLDKNDIRAANRIIREKNLDTLPIVDDYFCPVALVTDSDIRKNEMYPLATKDDNDRLRIFIAVESRLGPAKERIGLAHEVGVDGYITDSRNVFQDSYDIVKWSKNKSNFPDMQTIPGNVSSPELVRAVMKEASQYIDGLRLGVGQGDACDTPAILGLGSLQGHTVYKCATEIERLKELYGDMPLIPDGDVKIPADVLKALALGGKAVMCGSIVSRFIEAPGIQKYIVTEEEIDGKLKREMNLRKEYRGMASPEAIEERGAVRYGIDMAKIKVPEGHRKELELLGSGYAFIPYFVAAIKQGMHGLDCRNIEELQKTAYIEPSKYFRMKL